MEKEEVNRKRTEIVQMENFKEKVEGLEENLPLPMISQSRRRLLVQLIFSVVGSDGNNFKLNKVTVGRFEIKTIYRNIKGEF